MDISALLQIQFYNILTNVLSIILKNVTNILKIYELPKIYNKILKKLFKMTIYQINSMSQIHLASELYGKCTFGGKGFF